MFSPDWTIEALPTRIATLPHRRRRAQAIGDAGLKRAIDEEIAEAREQRRSIGRLGGTIVDAALRSPDSSANRSGVIG